MTRQYEAVYIFDSALDEATITEHLDQFHSLLAQPTAAAPACNHWGKRTLAYPIKNHETGYYVIAQFETATEALPEYQRAVKLDESVLRHLIVLNDGPQPVVPEATPTETKEATPTETKEATPTETKEATPTQTKEGDS